MVLDLVCMRCCEEDAKRQAWIQRNCRHNETTAVTPSSGPRNTHSCNEFLEIFNTFPVACSLNGALDEQSTKFADVCGQPLAY